MSSTIEGVRIVDMPDLGAFTSSSSLVGEHAGSGRFSASGLGSFFLPLTGGTVTGPTIFQDPATAVGAVPAVLQTTWTVNAPGGSTSPTFTVQSQTNNVTSITGAVGQNIWANLDQLFYSSPTPSASTPPASYVARYMQTVSGTDRGSGPTAPQVWSAIFGLVDTTAHPSSVSGQLLAVEIDLEAGGLDDANVRQGLVVLGLTRGYPTVPSSEFVRGIGVYSGDNGAVFKNQMSLGGRYNTAGISFLDSTSIGGAPAIWLPSDQAIAFDTSKQMQLRYSSSTTHVEWVWVGTPAWSLDVAGTTTQTGGLNVAAVANLNGGANFNSRSVYWDTAQTARTYWDPAALSGAGAVTFSSGVAFGGVLYSAGTATFANLFVVGATSLAGNVGFHGTPAIAKPTVSGAKGGNAALASLMTALAAHGLVTDSTT